MAYANAGCQAADHENRRREQASIAGETSADPLCPQRCRRIPPDNCIWCPRNPRKVRGRAIRCRRPSSGRSRRSNSIWPSPPTRSCADRTTNHHDQRRQGKSGCLRVAAVSCWARATLRELRQSSRRSGPLPPRRPIEATRPDVVGLAVPFGFDQQRVVRDVIESLCAPRPGARRTRGRTPRACRDLGREQPQKRRARGFGDP